MQNCKLLFLSSSGVITKLYHGLFFFLSFFIFNPNFLNNKCTAASERCSDGRNTQTRTATCVPHHHHQQATACQPNIEP